MKSICATVAATAGYAERFPELNFQPLSDTGLKVSPVGFGSYRIDTSFPQHREALRHALLSGINLIDTSANYTGGGSELLIGSAVEDLENEGVLRRDELVIVSKVGYLQGRIYRLSQNLKADGRGYPDLVEFAKNLEHCIHPAFIEDQLTLSLSRLNCGAIDVYLLHNPEYYLAWAHRSGVDSAAAQTEYYRRIKLAFEHLEKECERGRIRYYGISSNTFPVTPADPEFTSLERVLEIANGISPLHRFRVIQFPLNLIETGGVTNRTHVDGLSALDLARRHNLAVLTNRPLNAIQGSNLVRLSEDNPQAAMLRSLVGEIDSDWAQAATLSQMAVRALRSSLGVTCVLVGMRDPAYVDDQLAELTRPLRVNDRLESWQRLRLRLDGSISEN